MARSSEGGASEAPAIVHLNHPYRAKTSFRYQRTQHLHHADGAHFRFTATTEGAARRRGEKIMYYSMAFVCGNYLEYREAVVLGVDLCVHASTWPSRWA
jgi:hypothetical protein